MSRKLCIAFTFFCLLAFLVIEAPVDRLLKQLLVNTPLQAQSVQLKGFKLHFNDLMLTTDLKSENATFKPEISSLLRGELAGDIKMDLLGGGSQASIRKQNNELRITGTFNNIDLQQLPARDKLLLFNYVQDLSGEASGTFNIKLPSQSPHMAQTKINATIENLAVQPNHADNALSFDKISAQLNSENGRFYLNVEGSPKAKGYIKGKLQGRLNPRLTDSRMAGDGEVRLGVIQHKFSLLGTIGKPVIQ